MKKKVFRERYKNIPIPKQDEIYNMENLVKEIGKKAKSKIIKKKKSDK